MPTDPIVTALLDAVPDYGDGTYADEADADRRAQVAARVSAVLAAARAVVAAKDAGSPPPAIVVLLVENLRDALAAADAP